MKQTIDHFRTPLLFLLVVSALLLSQLALAGVNTFKSDDFNSRNLDRSLWTIRDTAPNVGSR